MVRTSRSPSGNSWFVTLLALNVCFFAWIAMLALGAAWHVADIGSPIGFLASLPIGLALTIVAFLVARRRAIDGSARSRASPE
jgi:hypothetical protein